MLNLILSRAARAMPSTVFKQAVMVSLGRFTHADITDYFEPLSSRRFALRLRANQVVDDKIRFFGSWEPDTTKMLPDLLKQGGVFFDVGANIGYYSVLAGLIVGNAGAVHAFEPFPSNFRALTYNVRLNTLANVTCNQLALDKVARERILHVHPKGDLGSTSFGPYVGNKPSSTIQTVTIDEYVESHRIQQVDLMKVDAEGAEFDILQGGTRLLSGKGKPNIIFEVNPLRLASLGASPSELLGLLRYYGYSLSLISPRQTKTLRKILDLKVEGGVDFLAMNS